MNRIILVLILLTMAATLAAQSSLFDISFGMPTADAEKLLEKKGFVVDSRSEGRIEFTHTAQPYVKKILLKFSEANKTISSWFVMYNTGGDKELEDEVFAIIESLHGTYDDWDDYMGEYVWWLDNDKALYVYWGEEDNLIAEYNEDYDY